MRTSRLFALAALIASFSWLLAGGCSSADDPRLGGGNTSGSGGSRSDPPDASIVDPDAATPGGTSNMKLNPLCGVGTCFPDSATSCRDYVPPSSGGEGGTGAAPGGAGSNQGGDVNAGTSGQAGMAGLGGGEGGQQGEGGAAGNAGAEQGGAGQAGEGGNGGQPEPESVYGCQVTRQNNEPSRRCEVAGSGAENAPCFSSADCRAGLACVTEGAAGRCLRYCCSTQTECGANTYCAERQLRADDGREATPVPVCVPADSCSLDEPYPCPEGQQCRCSADTACIVVRKRTTTCLKPGTGEQGDACPCAWNHLCSSATDQCVKICHTDAANNECGSQKCQASEELPQNFGICVGPIE